MEGVVDVSRDHARTSELFRREYKGLSVKSDTDHPKAFKTV